MARANTYTWLPLDHWARIMGYNLWLFNGFSQFPCTVGSECHDVWYQYPEQFDTLSREELAIAIKSAESQIANMVNFNLLPDWSWDVVPTPRYKTPMYTNTTKVNGLAKSVQVKKRYVWAIGTRTKTFVENAAILKVDLDGDGFAETGQITLSNAINQNYVKLYYPGENGSDAWEIRPITFVSDTIIQFPLYLVPRPEFTLPTCMEPMDPEDDVYLETVDVYQVENSTADIELVFPPCACGGCSLTAMLGCGYVDDEELGYVAYNPSTACLDGWIYDSGTGNCGTYDEENPAGRCLPDASKVKIYYYSGWQDTNSEKPLIDLDPYWWHPISYLAASILPRKPRNCCGGTQSQLVTRWAADLTLRDDQEARSYFATEFILNNPLGITTQGAYHAFQKARIKRIT